MIKKLIAVVAAVAIALFAVFLPLGHASANTGTIAPPDPPPCSGGLSQAWATIIAAGIALLAAVLALLGVWLRVRADARQAQRSERLRLLAAGIDQSQNMLEPAREIAELRSILDKANDEEGHHEPDMSLQMEYREQDKKLYEQFLSASLTRALMEIHRLPKSAKA
jgi:hypothetical protein